MFRFSSSFRRSLPALLLLFAGPTIAAALDARPPELNGANWQFGPHNRWAYAHLREVLPSKRIAHDPQRVVPLAGSPAGAELRLGTAIDDPMLADRMQALYVDGVVALVDGKLALEAYGPHLRADQPHLLWSVTKSMTGLLAGILAGRGELDLSARVGALVPELAATGWGEDPLTALLAMRDRSDWTEDYAAPDSTVRRQDCADGLLQGPACTGIEPVGNYGFLPGVGRDAARAGRFVYKSGTTDALAWALEAATGRRFADLLSLHLWQPVGAGQDADIIVDQSGFTLASGGLSATVRDLARVGQMVLDDGRVGSTQVVPVAWLREITGDPGTASWPFAAPSGHAPYYRNFFWGVGDGRGTVYAEGVHGQYLWIAPASGVVIAMVSSWPDADGGAPGVGRDAGIALLHAIERTLSRRPGAGPDRPSEAPVP